MFNHYTVDTQYWRVLKVPRQRHSSQHCERRNWAESTKSFCELQSWCQLIFVIIGTNQMSLQKSPSKCGNFWRILNMSSLISHKGGVGQFGTMEICCMSPQWKLKLIKSNQNSIESNRTSAPPVLIGT